MISKKQQANIVKPIIQIDGINIERVDHFNFLELTLYSRMAWNNHTTNISNKCSITIGVLKRIKHFIHLIVRILLHNTLILPQFNDCITAWGYQCDRIIKLQKKAIIIISISTYNAHTEASYNIKNTRHINVNITDTKKCTTNIEPINYPHIYTIGHNMQIKKYTTTIHAKQMSYTHTELFKCLQKSVSDIT